MDDFVGIENTSGLSGETGERALITNPDNEPGDRMCVSLNYFINEHRT